MDKTEHRLDKLEEGIVESTANIRKDFERITANLAETCGTLHRYEEKLENLWQWKLYQNGLLTDIRNEQKQITAMLNILWIKIVGGVVVAFIVNHFIAR